MPESKELQVYGGKVGNTDVFVFLTRGKGFRITARKNDIERSHEVPIYRSQSEYLDGTYDTIASLKDIVKAHVLLVTGDTATHTDLDNFYACIIYQLATIC